MPNEGWIKLYRSTRESSVWKNPIVFFVWTWCLLKASRQTINFPFGNKDMSLLPGEFVTGRNRATDELPGVSEQSYRSAIKYLKSTNRITTKSTNKFTIVSICKWEEYQGEVTSKVTSNLTNDQPASNQQVTTNNNDKKEKNERTNILSLTKNQKQSLSLEFPRIKLEKELAVANDYLRAEGLVKKDYLAWFRNWLRRKVDGLPPVTVNTPMPKLPEISEKDRIANLSKLAEMKRKLLV